jgi:hypothetical protein
MMSMTRKSSRTSPLNMVVLLLGLSLALAACASTRASGPSTDSHLLVTFRRTGGIAGVDDTLVIDNQGNGTATRRPSKTATVSLSPAERDQLRTMLDEAHFERLRSTYAPAAPVPDGYIYDLRYQGHAVEVHDPAAPTELQPVIGLLSEMLTRGG